MHYPSRDALIYTFIALFGLASTYAGLQDLMESRLSWQRGFSTATRSVEFSRGSDRFQIILDDIEQSKDAPASGTLEISQYGEDEYIDLSPGASFRLNDASGTVVAIRSYTGLWPDPQGIPMVGISIRRNGSWIENIALQSDEGLSVQSGLAVRFLWCADDGEARRRAAEGRPGIESARWGVRDSTRTHWSNSFLPGTGVELADGSTVKILGLLEDARGDPTAIEVEIRQADAVVRRRIATDADDPLIVFEYPALKAEVVLLHAWSEDKALLTYLPYGAESDQALLSIGQEWEGGGEGIAIRLEQISRAALKISPSQSGLFEAVLQIGSSRVRVREGQAVRVGDALLRYTHNASEPLEWYNMTLKSSAGDETRFILTPGNPFLFSTPNGNYSLHHRDVHPGIAIRLRSEDHSVPHRLFIGLFVLGLVTVTVARRRNATR